MRSNLVELMDALVQEKSRHEDPLLDGTFLATLQAPSHQELINACYDEPRPSRQLINALNAIGDAYVAQARFYRKQRVSDAIRLLSKLREAAVDQLNRTDPRPERRDYRTGATMPDGLRVVVDRWQREEIAVRNHHNEADDE